MLLDYRWFLRLPKASATIASLRRSCFREPHPAVSWRDKAYDSDELRNTLTAQGGCAVIPSKASRAQKYSYDKDLYKARSDIECTFNLLKQARRFATPYEKTLRNYAAVVALGCALLWLRI